MEPAETAVEEAAPRAGWGRGDFAIAACAAIATLLVHPVAAALNHPYWVDEAWVADLTRAPWSRMASVGSPTPVGFIALLKLVPGDGLQRGRLVVLGFSILAVVTAYVLGRSLPWKTLRVSRLAGIATAFVVMMAPLSLRRNDLKQYTCDAFFALLLLTLAVFVDREKGILAWWFGLAAVVALPFSSTSAFVSVAILTGLFVSAWLQGRKELVRDLLFVGSVVAFFAAAYFLFVVNPKVSTGLQDYWKGSYLYGAPDRMLRAWWTRLSWLSTQLAMPAIVFAAFFLAGIYELVRLKAWAVAIAVPLLWVEMLAIARLQKYPFLDLRTSQFLLVSSLAVVAIGAVGLARATARLHPAAGLTLAVVMAALFAFGSRDYVRSLSIAPEDVRTATRYVAANRVEGDVILVNDLGNFGFSYYWPRGRVVLHRDDSGAGFRASVAGVPAIFARDRSNVAVLRALQSALRRLEQAPPGARLFIVRTHVSAEEIAAWKQAFADTGVQPAVVRNGLDPVLVIRRP